MDGLDEIVGIDRAEANDRVAVDDGRYFVNRPLVGTSKGPSTLTSKVLLQLSASTTLKGVTRESA